MTARGPAPERHVPTSVTRCAGLRPGSYDVGAVPREEWSTGDLVVARVAPSARALRHVELPDGRMADVEEGDLLLGALGRRAATLEAVGDWRAVGDDLRMQALTSAGLFGRATSVSPFLPPLMELRYEGHALVGGTPYRMRDGVPPVAHVAYEIPTVLVVGTSMSAGKTRTGRVLVRLLRERGLRVFGAKLTGAARLRDSLALADAGAVGVLDFADGGLPSTAVPAEEYLAALRPLLARVVAAAPDVVVVEAGASPLEEYNGDTLVAELGDAVRCTVLCASDPYAVAGVVAAFGRHPDLVCGGAANTSAGVALVRRLTGLEALDANDPGSWPRLAEVVGGALGVQR